MLLNPALETIDFQKDDFGKQIEVVLDRGINVFKDRTIRDKYKDKDLLQCGWDLEKLIYDRIGVTMSINFNTYASGMAIYPVYNNHHILQKYKDFNEDAVNNNVLTEDTIVDLHKAKISGGFSKVKTYMLIDLYGNYFELGLTVSEITAIMLHEIGHVFTFFEYSNRLQSTNQIMLTLSETLKKDPKSKNRIFLYKKLDTLLKTGEEKFEYLDDNENRYILSIKMYRIFLKSFLFDKLSQMLNSKYDETSAEQLSDSFASRFGYGKYLVTGLDKYRRNGINRTLNAIDYLFIAIFFAYIGIFVFMVVAIFPLLIFVLIALGITLVYKSGEAFKDYDYDDYKERYKRVRHQYITMISTLKLEREELKDIIRSVDEIDKIIHQLPKKKTSLMSNVSNYLFKKNTNAKDDIEFQQLLEDLAHNDLFMRSAELRALT